MIKHIKQWYNGKQVKTFSDDVDDCDGTLRTVLDLTYHIKHHWTAKLARKVVSYVVTHHKWVIGVVLSIAAIIVTILVA